MNRQFFFIVFAFALFSSCDDQRPGQIGSVPVQEAVRMMADSLSRDLSQEGPMVWLHYFVRSDNFFMASDGKLVFPNNDSADVLVRAFATQVKRIQLTWTGMRVDSLGPGLALMAASFSEVHIHIDDSRVTVAGYFTGVVENTLSGWRVRDAHWSMGSQM